MRIPWLLALGVLFLSGCESTTTVEDPAETHFVKFYGRDGDQSGRDMVCMPDGSIVLFGTTKPTVPTNGVQWYVVKVDAKGTILWEQEFGGLGDEEARDIEIMASGNLMLVGNTYVDVANRDVMVMILSAADGTAIASAIVPTLNVNPPNLPTTGDEDASGITELSDGTLIISGSTTYTGPAKSTTGVPPGLVDTRDAMKIRLNPDLTFYSPWVQIYGFLADDGSTKIVQAPAGAGAFGSYYAFGFTNSVPIGTTPNYNFFLVVLSATGDPETVVTLSGTSGNEILSSVASQSTSFLLGGLLVGSSSDFYLAEATLPDPVLGFQKTWERNLAMSLGTNLSGHTAVAKANVGGGYFVLGEENGFGGNQNWVLTKVNNNGSLAWSQPIVYGGEGSDSAGAVKELADGRVVIIGTMRTGRPDAGEYKMTLIKVNPEGKFEK